VPTQVTLEVFTREGCPHCEEAKQFLVDLQRDRPDVQIVLHDILQDASALQRLRDLSAQRGVGTPGVPAFYLQGELIIGYAGPETTGARLRALVDQSRPSSVEPGVPPSTCLPDENPSCAGEASRAIGDTEAVEIPLFGYRLSAHQLGLPLFTFALGLLDGFNPCSMWVLILVVSLLASLKDRLKMMLIAGTFVAVEGIAYFAFMAAWLNLFLFIGLSRISEIILGGVACVAGMVNLKDFWAFSWGLSLSIPKTAKPGLYARLRRILQAENLTGALVGAAVLAVLVQLVELLCTMGFPALYTRILTQRQFDRWTYYGYLVLYNLAYMLDDVLVLAIGVVTLSQRRLQEKEGRWLKLLSGLVMIGLGIYLIVAPYWLNS
jgi:cytochrome c biogenesis protein CcdA/glutaredoxin